MDTTYIYKCGIFERQEKQLTFKEYMLLDRLRVGQKIWLGDVLEADGRITHENTLLIWVGDVTLYHGPSASDGGFGWDYSSDIMKKMVLSVDQY